jgi:hypothetical protein
MTSVEALASPVVASGEWWTDVAAGEWLTAIVAFLAAVVVAIQSVYTAHSAKASKDAAQAAVQGLTVATEALDIARDEEQHSRSLVIEAHRARIDAALPAISVIAGEAQVPLYICRQPEHGEWKVLLPTERLALPGHSGTALALGSWINLHNGSERVVDLTVAFTPSGNPGEPPGVMELAERRFVLAPGEGRQVSFLTWTTIADWVKNGAASLNHEEWSKRAAPTVSYDDPVDSGANRKWDIVVEGSPLAPVEGETDAYRQGSTRAAVRVLPERREYWLSKDQGIRLDPPVIG